jgi:hypothetical protein
MAEIDYSCHCSAPAACDRVAGSGGAPKARAMAFDVCEPRGSYAGEVPAMVPFSTGEYPPACERS